MGMLQSWVGLGWVVALYKFIECLSEELGTTTTHAYPNILTLDLDKVICLSKSIALSPCGL